MDTCVICLYMPLLLLCGNTKFKAMSQDRLIKIRNKKTGTTIFTTKNKKTNPKMKMKKYDPVTRKKEDFVEVK